MQDNKPIRATLSTQIVNQIEKSIREGIWPVGAKIPSEEELMREFGVSRSSVHGAILSLVHAGVLRSKQGDGTYVVRNNRVDAAIQNWLQSAELYDILETCLVLDSAIVRYACQRRTEEDLVALDQAYQARVGAQGMSFNAFNQVDKAFHIKIAHSSHNSILCGLYESFLSFRDSVFNNMH